MRITRVEIANFRGFENFVLELDGRSVLVIGENAGGKTALLTAIARGLGRDLNFRRPDFHDVSRPLELTVTLDSLTPAQRSIFGNHVDYVTGGPPALRTQARALWDTNLDDVEFEHVFPKQSHRSRRDEREAIPLLWLPAGREVARALQFGSTTNVMGRLLDDLPIDQSIDRAVQDIRDASERFGQDVELGRFLKDARDHLAGLLPGVVQDAFSMGLSSATGRDLLRQFELVVKHAGEPIPVTQQSSGLAQLSIFVFVMKLAKSQPGQIVLIDEPEISLHPQAQRSLVRALRELDAQVLIATHSANLLERSDPRDVVRLARSGAQTELANPSQLQDDEVKKFARFTNPHAAEAFFAHCVVLVEGESDRLALEALAQKKDRNLDSEGIAVVPINGASNAATYIDLFGPRGFRLVLAGLCDEAEERFFSGGLDRAGIASQPTRQDMEGLGFFVCVQDLEEELIRALGGQAAEQVIDSNGDLNDFQVFQTQAANQGLSTLEEQVRAFIKVGRAGRKIEYAPLLVDALPATNIPAPLEGVLAAV